MRKLVLIAVVAVLALTLVPLAVAGGPGGGWKHGHAKFNLVGKVTAVSVADPAVDPAALSTLTIKVQGGSHIKGLKRTETTFTVAASAKVWQLTGDGAVASELGKIAAGDKVKVKGVTKVEDGSRVYTITSVKYLDRTPDPLPPAEPVAQ